MQLPSIAPGKRFTLPRPTGSADALLLARLGRQHAEARRTLVVFSAEPADTQRLADELDGHYMDQFTYAERATDWRANNNIAESIFQQMRLEKHPVPNWLVSSAGTGGTVATLGRYVRYCARPTRVCAADPERSVFFDHYLSGQADLCLNECSRIEGIGRPRVEAAFLPEVIDAIAAVVETVEGVRLLDVDPGKATNRTVITFVGEPEPVCEAAFRLIRKTQELIDMRGHRGEHPRFGATDVCPLAVSYTHLTLPTNREV